MTRSYLSQGQGAGNASDVQIEWPVVSVVDRWRGGDGAAEIFSGQPRLRPPDLGWRRSIHRLYFSAATTRCGASIPGTGPHSRFEGALASLEIVRRRQVQSRRCRSKRWSGDLRALESHSIALPPLKRRSETLEPGFSHSGVANKIQSQLISKVDYWSVR